MSKQELPKEAHALLEEASKNTRRIEAQVLGEPITDSAEPDATWSAEATHGPADRHPGPTPGPHAGHIFLGNYIDGNTTFVVTGRKGGKVVREMHKLAAASTKWVSGWDTGAEQALVIQSRDQTFAAAPFWAAACFVWFKR